MSNRFKDRLSKSSLGKTVKSPASLFSEVSSTRALEGALVVPVELIVPNRFQIRRTFNEEALQELASDIKERGILEPLVIRVNEEERYEIIAGERRWRAAKLAGLEEVPVVVREMNDREVEFATLSENIQREELDPRDEQAFYRTLQNDFNLSLTDIGKLVKKSIMYVKRRLDGELVGMAVQTPQEPGPAAISPEDLPAAPKEKSGKKSPAHPRFAPSSLKRALLTLDRTSLYLEQGPSDPRVREHITRNLLEMQERIQNMLKELENVRK